MDPEYESARIDGLWRDYVAICRTRTRRLGVRRRYRRLGVHRLAEQRAFQLYTEAATPWLLDGLRRAEADWRSANSVAYDWLLPPGEALVKRLSQRERCHLARVDARAHLDLSEGASAMLRAGLPARFPFPAPSVVRQADPELVARLERERLERVWPALTAEERNAVENFTTDGRWYGYRQYHDDPSDPLIPLLRRSTLPEPVLAYRLEGVSDNAYRNLIYALRAGDEHHWDQPLSTALNAAPLHSLGKGSDDLNERKFADGHLDHAKTVMFELLTNQGLYIGEGTAASSQNEYELLLPPETSWLVVGHADLLQRSRRGGLCRRHMVQLIQRA